MAIQMMIYGDEAIANAKANGTYKSLETSKGIEHYEVIYTGCVVYKSERNGYDDSDFYALVWDEATQSIKEITYATTRFWSYNNFATIDATPEVLNKVYDLIYTQAVESWHKLNEQQANRVGLEKTVTFTKGRKVPKGTTGEVVWLGPDKFDRTKVRAGVKLSNGEKVFVDADNLTVVNPSQYLASPDNAHEYAVKMVRNSGF